MALATAAQAKLYIPELTSAGTAEDANLDTVIARVGGIFARWCGYPPASLGVVPTMESASRTLYLDGPGGRDLRLPTWPLTAITSIYDSPDRDYGSEDLVAAGDYTLVDGDHGLVVLDVDAAHGAWTTGRMAIKATVTAGFSTVPVDLVHLACLATKAAWDLRRNQGKSSLSQQGVSVGLRDEELLSPVVRAGLAI
mgnify:CR=1 FL=1